MRNGYDTVESLEVSVLAVDNYELTPCNRRQFTNIRPQRGFIESVASKFGALNSSGVGINPRYRTFLISKREEFPLSCFDIQTPAMHALSVDLKVLYICNSTVLPPSNLRDEIKSISSWSCSQDVETIEPPTVFCFAESN